MRYRGFIGLLKRHAPAKRHLALATLCMALLASTSIAHASDSFNTTLSMPSNNLGLVAHWTFDGPTISGTSVTDVSGQGNTGTLTNGPTVTPGIEGQALSYNGTNQYVDTNSHIGTLTTSSGSACVWAKNNRAYNSGVAEAIFDQGDTSGNTEFGLLHFSDNNIYAGFQTGGSDHRVILAATAANWPQGKWTSYCLTWTSGGTTSLYVNGALIGTQTGTVVYNSTDTLRLGYYWWSGSGNNYYSGSIDDFRIYNRALTAYEVSQLYNAGTATHQNATINPPDLQQGLVGHWTFDGPTISGTTVKDVSGSGNNGTMVNAPAVTPGVLGQALSFNGSNQYITIGTSATFNYERTQLMTICAWIKPVSVSENNVGRAIVSKLQGSPNYTGWEFNQYVPSAVNNGLQLYLINTFPGNSISASAANILTAGVWQHACVTYNGNSLVSGVTFYVNGVAHSAFSDINTLSGSILSSASTAIGGRPAGGNGYFNGSIDDVRIYNRALPASQITQLYDLGLGSHQNATVNPPNLQSGLVGHWTFDGPTISGTTVKDVSGSGNNGTMVNAPAVTPGVLGQAMSFNGSNQYVSISGYSAYDFGSNPFTASAWINLNALPTTAGNFSDGCAILSQLSSPQSYLKGFEWQISNPASGQTYSAKPGLYTGTAWALANTAVPLHVWTFLAVIHSGGTTYFYKNGVADGVVSEGGSATGILGMSIGARYSDPLYKPYCGGSIDDVRIYNRALSAAEVKQLYNLGK